MHSSKLNNAPSSASRTVARVLCLVLAATVVATALPAQRAAAFKRQEASSASTKSKQRAPEFVPGEVIIRFRSEAKAANEAATAALLSTASGRQIVARFERPRGFEIVGGLRLARVAEEDTLDAVAALSARPDVLYAEPNYVRRKMQTQTPNDARFAEMWHFRNTAQPGSGGNPGTADADIDADEAWTRTTGSRSIVVGVIDEGIDITHPDLQANVWTNPGETPANGLDDDANGFVDDLHGWDFFHQDATVYDNPSNLTGFDAPDSHGTHVAGIAGAVGNNSIGVTGVNWQVSLMSLKILGGEDELPAPSSVLQTVAAYNYAKQMREMFETTGGARGANLRVLNNSYGGDGRSQTELDAIRALSNAGILFVVSAGNEETNNDRLPVYPANYNAPNVITVAATGRSDLLSQASFTNTGPATVHMTAPGAEILSTLPGGTYGAADGTSMSAPQVAGAAALLWAAKPAASMRRVRSALLFGGDFVQTQNNHERTIAGRRLNVRGALENLDETDATAPGLIEIISFSPFFNTASMTWRATGDDGATGQATLYEIRYSDTAFSTPEQFESAYRFEVPKQNPLSPSQFLSTNLTFPWRHASGFIGIRAVDNAGNAGPITSIRLNIAENVRDPYTVSLSAAEPLSIGGTPLGLVADDEFKQFNLPFAVPFFGATRTFNFVSVSTNGALYFGFPPQHIHFIPGDVFNSVNALSAFNMIAPAWDDLRTDRRAGDDVYVVQPDANRVIFRWQGVTFNGPLSPGGPPRGENPVNFEVELRRDGTIVYRYGDGNQNLFPVVGISGGVPETYLVESHTSEFPARNLTNAQTVTFTMRSSTPTGFRISGRVTDGGGNGIDSATVTLSGTQSGQTTTDSLGNYNFMGLPAGDYVIGATKAGQFTSFAQTINNLNGDRTVDLLLIPFINISGSIRGPNNTIVPGMGYRVSGIFPVIHPVNANGNYSVNITPSATNPITITPVKYGYTFAPSSATFNSLGGGNQVVNFVGTLNNPIDASSAFVFQHYRDFLGRDPDAEGLAFWTNGIESCGPSVSCTEVKRVHTSAAFFLSIEFQETGYLTHRAHKAAFGNLPGKPVPLTLQDFLNGSQRIGDGVQVGVGNWQQRLEANKVAFFDEFVTRPQFAALYNGQTNAQYVEALNQNAGGALSQAERDALVADLNSSAKTRAQALRAVAEDADFVQSEKNRAFVLAQYFGYLRRNPDDVGFNGQPDPTFEGYNFWLAKLNEFNGNFIRAEMVKAFIESIEYRRRFSP